MTIYIEYVVIDNMVINYIILRFIDITTGVKIGKLNKFLVCVLGTAFAFAVPYLSGLKIIPIVYKLLVSIVLVMCIKKFKKFKNFCAYYFMFFTYTFLIGGLILFLLDIFNISYSASSIVMYNFDFPLGLFALIVLIALKVISRVLIMLKGKLVQSNYTCMVEVTDSGSSVKSTALLDSGNSVKFGDDRVSIISIDLFLKLHKDISLEDVLLRRQKLKTLKNLQYIPISGIGKKENYLSFSVDKIRVGDKEFLDQRVAVTLKNIGSFDCILHKEFF